MGHVFIENNKRQRRMSFFDSSFSLDVALHLFISFLYTGSKGEGVVRVSSLKYQVVLKITC